MFRRRRCSHAWRTSILARPDVSKESRHDQRCSAHDLGDSQAGRGTPPNGRWSYLHCNFPNHRAAALSVLGVPEDREVVREAVAKWDALELEEAIIAAKGAGGMVRSMEEWAKHPQAAAIASLPLMEIVKIGDSPPEKLPDGDRPCRV